MARTAPAVNGTPVTKTATYRFIDRTGDLRAVSVRVLPAATDAQIEALGDALADASYANLYAVEVGFSYGVIPSKSGATAGTRDSVFQNIVILNKTPAGQAVNVFIPAPLPATMVTDTDQVDVAAALLTAVVAAGNAILSAGGAAFEPVSVRYSERREINERTYL